MLDWLPLTALDILLYKQALYSSRTTPLLPEPKLQH
jgi:hypothetical protein